MNFDAKIPYGPLPDKWKIHCSKLDLVNPSNKKKFDIIVVGTGLAGSSASATLAELGYNVKAFCIQDSPRRAHSIAAQGGINAAKNYPNDGDSIERLFLDTIKGGDFRSRESNVFRLAQISNNIIDQCVAQGIPFAREYGGLLSNRSFGGAQVSRTFYARGQTGQQLLLGAYGAMMRQVSLGKVILYPRREILDLVVVENTIKGITTRNLASGEIEQYSGDAVLLCTGGYGNTFFLSTNAMGSNASCIYKAYKKGAFLANPCFTQIHPTCIPIHGTYQSKLTLMSESLRNDGRIWIPKMVKDSRAPEEIPEVERDYFLERKYPNFGNLVPRDVASRNVKRQCDLKKGVGSTGLAVYLDFSSAINQNGKKYIEKKYGNLFQMYERITADDPYEKPMMIYPAVHYTMGGLWVDYNLMSNVKGLFVLGEANFSDHGANRLGASALMQGLADGYFIVPHTIGDYLAKNGKNNTNVNNNKFFLKNKKFVKTKINKLMSINGRKTVDNFHKRLGKIMWNYCGMSRNNDGLKKAKGLIRDLRSEFWENVTITGSSNDFNQELEKAGRVADFLELGEIMIDDALERQESCGGHFNEKFQTKDNEALRDDKNFCHVSLWEYNEKQAIMHKEKLNFEYVELKQRSYK